MLNFWQKLPKPFTVLAPMDDVTDNVFRKVINNTSRPDVFFTEFTNSEGLISNGSSTVLRKLNYDKSQHPIVAQIWGNKPESMYKAAKIIKDLGFDGIDINMGCPVRDVVKKDAGAGMIGKYDLVKEVIEAVKFGANGIPVSVKTRLGIRENIIDEWATFLFNQNISALTIHGRTASQMSKNSASWDEIKKVVDIKNKISAKTVMIGNGDIKSYDQVSNAFQKYGVDGVMIGRGIFENPWVFEKTLNLDHSQKEYLDLLQTHLNYFEEENPDIKVMQKRYPALKKFFKVYVKNFNGANEFRRRLMLTKNLKEARELVNTLDSK